MRKRFAIAVMLAATLVLAIATVATAEATLTLSASRSAVTFPNNSVRLTVTFPTTEPTAAAILAMPANASEWTTVSADVTSTLVVKPRVNTVYKATLNGMDSGTVTVTVAAHLTKPTLPGSFRRGRTITIKGFMSPAENGATVTVTPYRWETVTKRNGKGQLKKSTAWVAHASFDVVLKAHSPGWSVWSTRTWKPTELGLYKIVVVHADLTHARSSAVAYTRVRR